MKALFVFNVYQIDPINHSKFFHDFRQIDEELENTHLCKFFASLKVESAKISDPQN